MSKEIRNLLVRRLRLKTSRKSQSISGVSSMVIRRSAVVGLILALCSFSLAARLVAEEPAAPDAAKSGTAVPDASAAERPTAGSTREEPLSSGQEEHTSELQSRPH